MQRFITRLRQLLITLAGSALLAGFTGSPAAQDPAAPVLADYPKLEQQFKEFSQAGQSAKALETLAKMIELVEPLHCEALYETAALYAGMNEPEKTFLYLDRARQAGFWDRRRFMNDQRFQALKTTDFYKTIAQGFWANGYIAMLERDERESFQKPGEVMTALALKPGETVADIGSGSGYFTVRFARAVEPGGTVHALDISQDMLNFLETRLKADQIGNVKLAKVQPDDPLLAPASIDTIVMVDTIHYVKDRAAYARKLRAGLKPGGRVVIIDYIPKPLDQRPWGPPPQQQFSKEQLDADFAAAGMKPAKVHTFLTEQYFVEYQVAN